MVLIVVVGDMHLKKDEPTRADLVISKITEQITKIKPDIVVLLGDILDTHEKIDMKTQNRAGKFIKHIAAMDIAVIVVIGNHERPDGTTFLTEDSSFYLLKGFKNIHIADRVLNLKWNVGDEKNPKHLRFIFAPYVPAGSFHEALDTLEEKVMEEGKRPAAIFCHQEFKGAKMGGYESKTGDEWPKSNPLIISGHIHTSQVVNGNIVYPGTPYQQSYNDDSEKGILVCNFGINSSPDIKFLKLDIRKKISITLKPSEVDNFVPPPNCDLQVDIVGSSAEIKDLRSRGLIPKMREKGISVSLSTMRDFNPNNPENKTFKSLLEDMIKEDPDVVQLYKKIFSKEQVSTGISIGSLSDLLKSAQAINPTNIAPVSREFLNSISANSRTAEIANYGTPINLQPLSVPQNKTPSKEQADINSIFSNFNNSLTGNLNQVSNNNNNNLPSYDYNSNPLSQTGKDPVSIGVIPTIPNQPISNTKQNSLMGLFGSDEEVSKPIASIQSVPNFMVSKTGGQHEMRSTAIDIMESMKNSAIQANKPPVNSFIESIMNNSINK